MAGQSEGWTEHGLKGQNAKIILVRVAQLCEAKT